MNPFAPSDTSGGVTIETIAAGSMVFPEDEIPLSVRVAAGATEADAPTGGYARLYSSQGTVISEQAFGSIQPSGVENQVLLVPEDAPPIVDLVIRIEGPGEVLAEERRQVFVTDEELGVADLVLYPPVAETSSQVLATIEIESGDTLRPYLRWFFDDSLKAEGYWEEDFSVVFETPRDEGVYGLRVDVYPYGPDEGVRFHDSPAPVTFRSELYVVFIRDPGPGELEPTDETIGLYHLAGNFRNSVTSVYDESRESRAGRNGDSLRLEPIGEPILMIQDDVFGYYLGGAVPLDYSSDRDISAVDAADQNTTTDSTNLEQTDPVQPDAAQPTSEQPESELPNSEQPDSGQSDPELAGIGGVVETRNGMPNPEIGRTPTGVTAPIAAIPPANDTVQVDLQFMPFAPSASARLLESQSSSRETLTVDWFEGMTLEAEFGTSLATETMVVPLMPVYGKTHLTVIAGRTEEIISFSWFQDNVPLAMFEFPNDQPERSDYDQWTTVSGTGGIVGIFDELSFSLANGVDFLRRQQDMILDHLTDRYGHDLLAADLFVSVGPDTNWSTEELTFDEKAIQAHLSSTKPFSDSPMRLDLQYGVGEASVRVGSEYVVVSTDGGELELDHLDRESPYRSTIQAETEPGQLVLKIDGLQPVYLSGNAQPSLSPLEPPSAADEVEATTSDVANTPSQDQMTQEADEQPNPASPTPEVVTLNVYPDNGESVQLSQLLVIRAEKNASK